MIDCPTTYTILTPYLGPLDAEFGADVLILGEGDAPLGQVAPVGEATIQNDGLHAAVEGVPVVGAAQDAPDTAADATGHGGGQERQQQR